jgi:aminopeptidase N
MRTLNHCFSFLFIFILFANVQPLHAKAKRKDIGKLVFERSCFDVIHYDIKVKIKPNEKFISGSNSIEFKMLATSSKIQFDYTENMGIDSAKYKGKPIAFKRKGNKVKLEFIGGLQIDSTYKVEFCFSGKPLVAKLAPWDGGFVWRKDNNGYDWVGLACEGLGASAWLPCKDHWSDEAEGADITLIVPKDLTGVSNGKLIDEKIVDSAFKAFHWRVVNPINNYNISINVGHYINIKDTFLGVNTVPLSYYVLDYNKASAERHFLQVHGMLDAFEHFFGQYPFNTDGYKLVETPYWGMEHQSCIAYGNNYKNNVFGFDFIIIHESGHEWFGNSITASDAADMWIHESFTTYAEALYMEYRVDKTRAIEYLSEQRKKIVSKHPMQGPRGVFYHGRTDSDIYYKGTWMLHTMRNILNNDSLWFATLKEMNSVFFHKIVCTEEIIQFFNNNTSYNWDLFFKQYLYKSSIPELEIKQTILKNGKIIYSIRLESDLKDLNIPLNIKLANGEVIGIVVSDKPIVIELDNRFDLYAFIEANYLLRIERE